MQHERYAQLIRLHDDIQPAESAIAGDICMIGRSPECQIVIPRKTVSRLHAKVERDGTRYMLTDAGSANGTFVNGRRIAGSHILKNRDAIGLGSALAMLRFIDPDPTFETSDLIMYDERTMRFFVREQALDLTPTQLRLLLHLYQHVGNVCTREGCMEAIWGVDYDRSMDSQVLDGVVSAVRRKLREADPLADCITTRRGIGYELIF